MIAAAASRRRCRQPGRSSRPRDSAGRKSAFAALDPRWTSEMNRVRNFFGAAAGIVFQNRCVCTSLCADSCNRRLTVAIGLAGRPANAASSKRTRLAKRCREIAGSNFRQKTWEASPANPLISFSSENYHLCFSTLPPPKRYFLPSPSREPGAHRVSGRAAAPDRSHYGSAAG